MLSGTGRTRPKTINLNLIPLELRQPFFTRRTSLLLGGILLGLALFFVIDNQRAAIEWQLYDLEGQSTATTAAMRKENARIAVEQAESAKIALDLKRLKDDIARFSDNPQSRTRRLISLSPSVQVALDASQPAGVQLTTLSWQEPKLTVQGKAQSTQQITAYTDGLARSKRFSKVDLKMVLVTPAPAGSGSPSAGDYSFTIELAVLVAGSTG
ncbi:MAG: PilN domain-containing protein [Dehalococcoidia bacterium]|nr:PilN domain-containing protein [Dehalococcoidia bacterium]